MHKAELRPTGEPQKSGSAYSITTADRNRAALHSDKSERVPLSVVLNVETFESMLELASRLDLNCLTQKCEDTLASSEFQLTTGNSQRDSHSVVRWAYIAQKHHLVALQLRCERFMCDNFHKILDDPLLHTLARHSLLSMLRAQSAMLSVYRQHIPVPETWGLTRAGAHGAQPRGRQRSRGYSLSSDMGSGNESDLDTSSDAAELSGDTSELSLEPSLDSPELCSTADSKLSQAQSHRHRRKRRSGASSLCRTWSYPGFVCGGEVTTE